MQKGAEEYGSPRRHFPADTTLLLQNIGLAIVAPSRRVATPEITAAVDVDVQSESIWLRIRRRVPETEAEKEARLWQIVRDNYREIEQSAEFKAYQVAFKRKEEVAKAAPKNSKCAAAMKIKAAAWKEEFQKKVRMKTISEHHDNSNGADPHTATSGQHGGTVERRSLSIGAEQCDLQSVLLAPHDLTPEGVDSDLWAQILLQEQEGGAALALTRTTSTTATDKVPDSESDTWRSFSLPAAVNTAGVLRASDETNQPQDHGGALCGMECHSPPVETQGTGNHSASCTFVVKRGIKAKHVGTSSNKNDQIANAARPTGIKRDRGRAALEPAENKMERGGGRRGRLPTYGEEVIGHNGEILGKRGQFRKTKMCKFFLMGICSKGEDCMFAHDSGDLQVLPDLQKTKLCEELLETGRCRKGDRCTYAHSKAELRATAGFLKTKLCKFYQEGHCVLGANCRYAHEAEELRCAEIRVMGADSGGGGSSSSGGGGGSSSSSSGPRGRGQQGGGRSNSYGRLAGGRGANGGGSSNNLNARGAGGATRRGSGDLGQHPPGAPAYYNRLEVGVDPEQEEIWGTEDGTMMCVPVVDNGEEQLEIPENSEETERGGGEQQQGSTTAGAALQDGFAGLAHGQQQIGGSAQASSSTHSSETRAIGTKDATTTAHESINGRNAGGAMVMEGGNSHQQEACAAAPPAAGSGMGLGYYDYSGVDYGGNDQMNQYYQPNQHEQLFADQHWMGAGGSGAIPDATPGGGGGQKTVTEQQQTRCLGHKHNAGFDATAPRSKDILFRAPPSRGTDEHERSTPEFPDLDKPLLDPFV
eukprot:g12072.t1